MKKGKIDRLSKLNGITPVLVIIDTFLTQAAAFVAQNRIAPAVYDSKL